MRFVNYIVAALLLLTMCACSTTKMSKTLLNTEDMPDVEFKYALEIMNNGEWQQAEKAFLAMTKRYPDYSGPWTNLGIISAGRGDASKAETYFKKAVESNPKNAIAMTGVAILLHQQGDLGALTWYQRAISAQPDYPEAYFNLAQFYEKMLRKPEKALSYYRRYQSLTNEKNLAVAAWILELEQIKSTEDSQMVVSQ